MNDSNNRSIKKKARVYSYIRFSTPEQAMGHSERRQFEAAEEWVKRKKLRLDNQLTDRGLSGYHGDHRTKGALGTFLQRVEEGKVPPGSILLVENIDRLSREGAVNTLREVIFKIWDHDITLQTLGPEETFEPGCADKPHFLGLLFSIQRAQSESQRKSELIRASRLRSFEMARSEGRIVTAQCPNWLKKADDHNFIVRKGAAETIRLIFDLKLQGFGQQKMVGLLNAEALWKPDPKKTTSREAGLSGNGWHSGYVKKILNNRAVIGEYQPHQKINGKREPSGPPIDDYYPSIVDTDVFFAVQKLLDANRGKGGRTGKKRNVLTHIIKCGYCGGSMRFLDKGKPKWRYFVCDNAFRRVSCKRHYVRYAEAQDMVIEGCRHLRPEQVLPNTDEQANVVNSMRQSIKAGESINEDIQQRIDNFIEQIGGAKQPKIRDAYEVQLERLYAQTDSVATKLERDRRELTDAESLSKRFKSWKHGLAELVGAIADEEAAEIRAKLNLHLREFIESIEVFPVGFRDVADPNDPRDWDTRELVHLKGKVVKRENGRRARRAGKKCYLPHLETIHVTLESFWSKAEHQPTNAQRDAFGNHLLKRRMSKEGRFYRIRFINGERIDIVPPDSLATGLRAINGSVEMVLPDIERLWRESLNDGRVVG